MFGIGSSSTRTGVPPTGAPWLRSTPRPRHWARARAENPLTCFVPFSSLVSPVDVITRGGDYLRVWRLDGVAFECADEHVIAERHEAKCSLLRNLAGGQFAVWEHRLHRTIADDLSVPPEPGFARDLARAHGGLLRQQRMMSNELYLTLVYRPTVSSVGRAFQCTRRTRHDIVRSQAEALRVMDEKSALVERVLRGFGPELLGTVTRNGREYSEVAEFLGYLVNGCWRPVLMHAGPLYRTLPTARLSFGADKLEIRNGEQRRYAAFLDIHEYADAVEPGVLNALLYERSEFIETQSFSILPRREAMRALELQRDQLIASDDVVESQIAEMDVALNELGDGQFCMGEYHYSLLVFGDDVADAGRRAARAIGAVGEACSLQMRPVDLVADAAWFAQLPGNWQWRPREAKLSSRAYAALASGHNFARGKRDGNPWGEALVLLPTPSGQPFFLNLHKSPEDEDSEDKKLPGNTLIIGSTGVGKTTLLMLLLPADERAIAAAVRSVAMMPKPLRRFSTVRQNLPKNGENSLYERLGRWCQGGALGWVFDEADDRLTDLMQARAIGFDTTEFLDLPEVRTPIMLYLLDVMGELVNGERLIYVISEFWKALDNEIFSDFAKQKQKTIRKQNGLGIFDTQSPSDALDHAIGRTMVEQSVTKIFLANPDALKKEYVEGFGLSEAEYEVVKGLGARGGRTFMVKQGHSSAICELDLSGLEDFVTVLSGTTDNVALLDGIRECVGDDPQVWLPVLLDAVRERKSKPQRSAP